MGVGLEGSESGDHIQPPSLAMDDDAGDAIVHLLKMICDPSSASLKCVVRRWCG
ncbi:hypothetical protein L208DRAFT_1390128 [Tricholoma matsutake]|nr:hypothetical protein L208DRAFT_1390128 [Tricholoma matsutake 945]